MQMESLKDSYKDDEVIGKLAGDFTEQLKMKEMIVENQENDDGEDDDEEYEVEFGEEDDEEEEFSFASGTNAPPVTAAEEIFYNGQIRPLFPLFNQKLLLSDDDLEKMKERSPVKKVFIETPASSSSENQEVNEVNGPYCEWSKNKAIEASPEICKKSNSTGFSKLWRFTDIFHRSNSDGRDAFVFLNPEKVDHHRKNESSSSSSSENQDSGKVKVNVSTQKKKKKVIIMKKSEGLLAHEAYMKSKAKHVDRLRSDLPYRPELVGFFTNVKGGMTRNVHPF